MVGQESQLFVQNDEGDSEVVPMMSAVLAGFPSHQHSVLLLV